MHTCVSMVLRRKCDVLFEPVCMRLCVCIYVHRHADNFITGQNEREETTQNTTVTKSAACASYKSNYVTYLTRTCVHVCNNELFSSGGSAHRAMYVCMFVCTCVCMNLYVCEPVCMRVCVYFCVYVCMYRHTHACMSATAQNMCSVLSTGGTHACVLRKKWSHNKHLQTMIHTYIHT
jgi:hypothetical protein